MLKERSLEHRVVGAAGRQTVESRHQRTWKTMVRAEVLIVSRAIALEN